MIQFITHTTARFSYIESARLALAGGCKWIQLRMKEASEEEIISMGKVVAQLCQEAGATFIIDDHVALVSVIRADGVHLGKNDMPPTEARALLGADKIIGGTANTFEDIEQLVSAGVDYIGLGPFRYTETKKNLSPVLGIDGYRKILASCRQKSYHIPIVAIGGITNIDIPSIMETGVSGIALSGTILQAADPVEETKQILQYIINSKKYE